MLDAKGLMKAASIPVLHRMDSEAGIQGFVWPTEWNFNTRRFTTFGVALHFLLLNQSVIRQETGATMKTRMHFCAVCERQTPHLYRPASTATLVALLMLGILPGLIYLYIGMVRADLTAHCVVDHSALARTAAMNTAAKELT
jgi:hypothetical protein